jgi:ketosteroid isomerase-like protein
MRSIDSIVPHRRESRSAATRAVETVLSGGPAIARVDFDDGRRPLLMARPPTLRNTESRMLQATADPAVVHQLEALESQLASAWKARDCAGWGALLADDWTVTHINAQIIAKSQALEMCQTGPPVASSVDQLAVRIYGDTAIVTGRTTATAEGAAPQTVVLRFTDVVVKRDGRWIAVASHATQVQDTR